MPGSSENLYPKIGQAISEAIPEQWSSAWVTVDIQPDVISLQRCFAPIDGRPPRSIVLSHQLVDLFNQLHAALAHENWKSARFDLNYSGKFSLQFEY